MTRLNVKRRLSVTVVSCAYGDYDRFIQRWWQAVETLDPPAHEGLVIRDYVRCTWKHPQAFYLQKAISLAETEWVWIVDIDDLALPDGLAGLEHVTADVWAVGFERSDGELYLPPQLTAEQVLAAPRSLIPGASMIRTEAFHAAGGFQDVALQDWALWRALARNGATFESSGRAHFRYMRHPATRGATELTVEARPAHYAEMLESELAAA